MRLTDYTDYTLRVLIYCASNPSRRVTISEIADAYSISRNHLTKIVHELGRQGVLETSRGRGGGLRLLRAPSQITVGEIVRAAETDFALVECFDRRTNRCRLTPHCRLRRALKRALDAYLAELDGVTIEDISVRTTSGGRSLPMIATPGPG
ncbi:MAG: Rrf2 family transcriptional regulator [Burkholderiales bacterium]|jgi:Rrf2 family nitric oxide-sensitive transcriptional repressor|nr:Rrf2 family transcriptional regulator [Burkholderiales bacterium]